MEGAGFHESWGGPMQQPERGATLKGVLGRGAPNTMVLNVLSWVPCR